MFARLRALLSEIIDYAGLFPPAALDMRTAVRNYAAYGAGDDSAMLGRFVVPASRLSELGPSDHLDSRAWADIEAALEAD